MNDSRLEIVTPDSQISEDMPTGKLTDWWTAVVREGFLEKLHQRFGSKMEASISILDPTSFQGRIRSGRLGPIRYCHIQAAASTYAHQIHLPAVQGHSVMLQLSGVTEVHSRRERRQLRPGDLLLISDLRHLRIDNLGSVEHILLLNPLDRQASIDTQNALLVRRINQSSMTRMAYRWTSDACSDTDWNPIGMGNTLASCVSGLLHAVFSQSVKPHKEGKICYEDVLRHITRSLTDADLGVASIARALGCSVRTLHRISRNEGRETIERSIKRMRVEKCGELLHTDQVHDITDLSTLFCFSSPAHFSTAFRSIFGVPPSQYRQTRTRSLPGKQCGS